MGAQCIWTSREGEALPDRADVEVALNAFDVEVVFGGSGSDSS